MTNAYIQIIYLKNQAGEKKRDLWIVIISHTLFLLTFEQLIIWPSEYVDRVPYLSPRMYMGPDGEARMGAHVAVGNVVELTQVAGPMLSSYKLSHEKPELKRGKLIFDKKIPLYNTVQNGSVLSGSRISPSPSLKLSLCL